MWQDMRFYWAWRGMKPCTPAPTQKVIVPGVNKYGVKEAQFVMDVAPDGTVIDVATLYEVANRNERRCGA